MSKPCTFRDLTTPACAQPATYRVVKGWLHSSSTWRIEEALEPETALPGATTDSQAEYGHQVPEFCLHHAATVMDQRNRARR